MTGFLESMNEREGELIQKRQENRQLCNEYIAQVSKRQSQARRQASAILEGVKAVHFSISCLPSRSEGRDAWLETIEYFFFSLLVLRECSDTSSGICNVLPRLAIRYYAWERANTTRALSTRAVEETKMNVTRVVFSSDGLSLLLVSTENGLLSS